MEGADLSNILHLRNVCLYVLAHAGVDILFPKVGFQEIQYCSDHSFDLLFAPTEFAFNAWFGSLDRDWLLPEVTLGFLEKDLLPPEDSSFSLGIHLGTYIYNRR